MNIFEHFRARIAAAVGEFDLPADVVSALPVERITVEPPRDAAHGDIATNAAMVLSKAAGAKPRDLAEQLVALLKGDADVDHAEVAGPGFINLRLSPAFWHAQLHSVLDAGADYGRANLKNASKINVEYVSANPTGPMHVGHCRGAVVGDVLANLLAFAGHDITKEYYINDAGSQIDVLARSALLRYREALGEDIGDIPEGLYPGEYLVPVGAALKTEFGDALATMTEAAALDEVKPRVIDAMMAMIRDDLAALNVHHDVFFSERGLHAGNGSRIRSAINELVMKGHVYKGKLPPPKGQVPDDWEDREQTLFKSTEVGDDQDRPLIKSDGSFTYFAADVAYFYDKFGRGFDETIFILGADHGGYVKRMEALAKAVSEGSVQMTILLCQLVKLFKNGEQFKMSKRSGQFVTLRDVVDEVGRDAVRFMMVYRKNSEPLDFDFDKVTEQSKDNPVFYVQYASARCHSVYRQAAEQFGGVAPPPGNLEALTDEGELAIIRKLAEYPRLIDAAANTREPHRIAFYLYDLASMFHAHWNRGSGEEALRFVKVNNPSLTSARLALVQGVLNVLTSGLTLLGVEAPREMR
ncbi:MAG: arginine--tRNA ligase [Pseudomonadota bacterium]